MKGKDKKYTVAMIGKLDSVLYSRQSRADDLTGTKDVLDNLTQVLKNKAILNC